MTTLAEIRAKREELEAIGRKYGVSNIRIFGSVARGEARPDSDVDLLVTLEKGRDYFDLGGFQYLSSQLLHTHVDVVMDTHIHQKLAPYITQDATPL